MSYLLGVAGMSNSNSIFNRLERLKHIGEQLIFRELTLEDKKFVSEALIQIGNGEEPKVALDIKGRTGESKGGFEENDLIEKIKKTKELLKYVENKKIIKSIFIKNKLINLIVK